MGRVLTELTADECAEALARLQVVRPFLEADAALTDIARQHPCPLRTLRRMPPCACGLLACERQAHPKTD